MISYDNCLFKCVRSVSRFIFLHGGCPFVSALFVEMTVFSLLCCFCSFFKNQLTIFMGIYFWALHSVPLIYFSILSPVPQCLVYCSFRVSLKVKQCQSSNFVLLLQHCVGYLGSFASPYKI